MKKYLLLAILLLNVGCAALTNNNKPELRDDRAIASAYINKVIERYNRYEYGNLLMIVSVVGTVPGLIGALYDMDNNNYWVVTDKEGYEAWKVQYLDLIKKRREELLNGSKN
ncbi:MAG: hypothetical protein LBH40_05260 [Alphaproteobacteria bacterium]|jgi:hypothetical protein|nr:hypothetical protein [Alphaproteobacteria bacterium]